MSNSIIEGVKRITQKFLSEGHERSIKAKKNILGLLILKGMGIAISFLSVPLIINYIDPLKYGIWLTLGSMVGWFTYLDIGFGHGLRNKFTEAVANNNFKDARVYVSTTYISLSALIGVVLLLFLAVNPFLNWTSILNAPVEMKTELSTLALIIFAFFCMQFVFQLITNVLTAHHEPSKASFLQTLGSLISLMIIFVLTKTTSGSLINLGIVLSVTPVVVMGIAGLWFYNTSYKIFAPSFKFFRFKYVKQLMTLGTQFFIIQITVIIMLNTDNIVITQILGPESVTIFNVVYKLFMAVSMVYILIATPLWSAYTEAYIKGDFDWIKNTLRTTGKIWWALSALTILVLCISPFLFKLWLGDSVIVPFSLSVATSTYVIGYIWVTQYTFLLNGLGKIRLQLYVSVIAGLFYIPLVIYCGKIWGLIGITLLSTLVFVFTGLIFKIQVRKLLDGSASGIWNR